MNQHQKQDIRYDYRNNLHSRRGPEVALPILLKDLQVDSLLDVGCGTGTWLRAAQDMGVGHVQGLDGVSLPQNELLVDKSLVQNCDFREKWRISRHYDVVICLEVAEHLEDRYAAPLIQNLTSHTDRVIFSAAIPWQTGEYHVNCQWPSYWQEHFNREGFVCRDTLRWRLWELSDVEPWYRQNLFLAERNEDEAGREPRIPGVIHPDSMATMCLAWRNANQSLPEGVAKLFDRGICRLLGKERKNKYPNGVETP